MKYSGLLFFITCVSVKLFAGSVDTVSIYSNSMHKQIKAVVIKPDSYQTKNKRYPVVYLLHGYDGWYSNWIIRAPELKEYATTYQSIIVCPDGATSSWYWDSPADTACRYETHIAIEVVEFVDKNYKTIADQKHRAITGLSMGGHGALFIGLRHSSVFGSAGSMSGGVDLMEYRNSFDISKRIGDTGTQSKYWHDLTVISLVENYENTDLKIIFDCGNKDFFVGGNRKLHQKLLLLKIPHDYIEREGEHNWDYWKKSLPYHLLYFRIFFDENK